MEQGQQNFESQSESTASGAVEALQREASDLGREAKRASSQLLEQRFDKVFAFFDDVENAVRAAARELETEQHPTIAHYVNRAADEVAQARGKFGSPDLNEMISSAENLARTRPLATLGMAFAAGFAFVRLLKSSVPHDTERRQARSPEDDDDAAFGTGRESSTGGYGGGASYGTAYRGQGARSSQGHGGSRKDDPAEGRNE
jgi:hypothetical protein